MYLVDSVEKAYCGSVDALMLCKDSLSLYLDCLKEIYPIDDKEYNDQEQAIILQSMDCVCSAIDKINRSVYLLQNCI